MRVQEQAFLPTDIAHLVRQLTTLHRQVATQLNMLSEGRITAAHNAVTAAPTTGEWHQGDYLRNSQPEELGSPGSAYVVFGWQCLVSGEPGTWAELRFLTGN